MYPKWNIVFEDDNIKIECNVISDISILLKKEQRTLLFPYHTALVKEKRIGQHFFLLDENENVISEGDMNFGDKMNEVEATIYGFLSLIHNEGIGNDKMYKLFITYYQLILNSILQEK